MADIITIPKINAHRFYHAYDFPTTTVINQVFNQQYQTRPMDSDWFYNNVSSYITKEKYAQPVQTNDPITGQFVGRASHIAIPFVFQVLDCNGDVVIEQNCTIADTLPSGAKIWEYNLLLWNLDEGYYFFRILRRGYLSGKDAYFISEPVHLKETHKNTLLLKAKHRRNDYGIYWETGIVIHKRIYADLLEFKPESKSTSYENQPMDLEIISGYAYRSRNLWLGTEGRYMPDYEYDILNRLFNCSSTTLDGVYYTKNDGAQIEINNNPDIATHQAKLQLREKNATSGLTVTDIEEIVVTSIPTTTYFYVEEISLPSNPPIPIQKYFKSLQRFVAFLNFYIIEGHKEIEPVAFFTVSSDDKLIIKTSTTSAFTDYDGTTMGDVLQYWIAFDIEKIGASDTIIIDGTGTSGSYVLITNDEDQTIIVSDTYTGSFSEPHTTTTSKTILLFHDSLEEIDISSSDSIVTALDGELTPEMVQVNASFGASGVIKKVKRNMWLTCTGYFNSLILTNNQIPTSNIDTILMYLYEADKISALEPSSASITLSANNPPSKSDLFYKKSLVSSGHTVTTD